MKYCRDVARLRLYLYGEKTDFCYENYLSCQIRHLDTLKLCTV